jgi:small subunit ribosomal protein S21
MPGVVVKENESFENALRRFKKQIQKSGVLAEVKKRRGYDKPSVKRKKKSLLARKRILRKLRKMARMRQR